MLKSLIAFAACLACAQTARLEDSERRIGPLKIGRARFTVVLQLKRVAGGSDPDFQETVAAIEIRDAAGGTHYRRTFSYELEGNRFRETVAAAAWAFQGGRHAGLLVTYSFLPSAPLTGELWHIFGLSGGKLVSFGKPIGATGELMGLSKAADQLDIRVWTGHFFMIVPLRLDWVARQVMPPPAKGRFRVEAERRPEDEPLPVRMFPQPGEGLAERVTVRKDSEVEFLEAEAGVRFDERTDLVELGVADDTWLKVRVDGKTGWIHGEKDFQAIGLPTAG